MQRNASALIATHLVLRFTQVSAAGLLPDRLVTVGLAFTAGCVTWLSPLPRGLASHNLITWNVLTFDQDWRRNTHR